MYLLTFRAGFGTIWLAIVPPSLETRPLFVQFDVRIVLKGGVFSTEFAYYKIAIAPVFEFFHRLLLLAYVASAFHWSTSLIAPDLQSIHVTVNDAM
jgi:hypothetical protein